MGVALHSASEGCASALCCSSLAIPYFVSAMCALRVLKMSIESVLFTVFINNQALEQYLNLHFKYVYSPISTYKEL